IRSYFDGDRLSYSTRSGRWFSINSIPGSFHFSYTRSTYPNPEPGLHFRSSHWGIINLPTTAPAPVSSSGPAATNPTTRPIFVPINRSIAYLGPYRPPWFHWGFGL